MAVTPPPYRDLITSSNQNSTVWMKWFKDLYKLASIDVTNKADKVAGAVVDNFASLTATGNLADSGHKDADYADSVHVHQAAPSGGTLDHGLALTGLGDNDHTIYVNAVAAAPLTLAAQSVTFNYTASHFGLSGNNLQTKAILADGTAGRILKQSQLLIEDGTNVATLKCTVSSLWNGDAIGATDNVAKGATTGNFTLNAGGTILTIEAAGLTGNCVMAMGVLSSNSTATALNLDCVASGNDIVMSVRNTTTGAAQDITGLTGVGATLTFYILYLTAA